MARKASQKPAITYCEILSRAHRDICREIGEWEQKFEGLPPEKLQAFLDGQGWQEKREALERLYEIETGSAFG